MRIYEKKANWDSSDYGITGLGGAVNEFGLFSIS
jgi:hypothetical protein